MQADRLDARGESTAEQTDKFGHGEVEKRAVAACFQLGGKAAAEISFDHRPPERPELISGGRGAVGVAEQPHVVVEFLRSFERHEQFVGKPERQTDARLAVFSGSAGVNKSRSAASSALGTVTIA